MLCTRWFTRFFWSIFVFILIPIQIINKKSTDSTYATELNISEKIKATLGVRYEEYNVLYSGQNVSGEVYDNEEFINVKDFYPSANFIYSINDDTKLRASYSMTTARPSFKENSAANIYDPITERFFVGNIDLKPTYIDNFDILQKRSNNVIDVFH